MRTDLPSAPGPDGAEFILTLRCPDRPGLVHAVSGFLLERGGNILASAQYGAAETGRFFMRIQFSLPDPDVDAAALCGEFAEVGDRFGMTWDLYSADTPYRTLVMVSRFGHCLNDLLFRWSTGTLHIEIP